MAFSTNVQTAVDAAVAAIVAAQTACRDNAATGDGKTALADQWPAVYDYLMEELNKTPKPQKSYT